MRTTKRKEAVLCEERVIYVCFYVFFYCYRNSSLGRFSEAFWGSVSSFEKGVFVFGDLGDEAGVRACVRASVCV
jgi:hypothetical protein